MNSGLDRSHDLSMPNPSLPFSRAQFFDVFAAYNEAIWPSQVYAYGLAAAVLALIWTRWRNAHRFALVGLAALWVWTGLVYHISYFAPINHVAKLFGALFVAQGLLLLANAVRGDVAFTFKTNSSGVAVLLLVYSMLLYPLLNLLGGHGYPAAPSFGVTPCPLVIFTFALFLLTPARAPWSLLAIPTLWSIVGGSAAWLLGVLPDLALPVSAVFALVINGSKPRLPARTGTALDQAPAS